MRPIIALFFVALMATAASAAPTDAEIKQVIIQQSLASYPGPCPCPYNTMRNGRQCGGNSAYSKPGGYEPICYETQVTPQMIRLYRALHSKTEMAPPCKAGKATCQPWERDWADNPPLAKGDVVTTDGRIIRNH
jgi:hypothetical protein